MFVVGSFSAVCVSDVRCKDVNQEEQVLCQSRFWAALATETALERNWNSCCIRFPPCSARIYPFLSLCLHTSCNCINWYDSHMRCMDWSVLLPLDNKRQVTVTDWLVFPIPDIPAPFSTPILSYSPLPAFTTWGKGTAVLAVNSLPAYQVTLCFGDNTVRVDCLTLDTPGFMGYCTPAL